MADLNYVSPLTSDLTDYYTKTEVDELQQGDENRFATQAQITAGDNEVKGWVASQGYLTQHQSLQNYATKEYVNAAIEDIEVEGGVKIRVVSNLPANPETNVIYLTRRSSEEDDNVYNEWIYVEDIEDFELIGDTSTGVLPDLTDYATKSYVDTAVAAIDVPADAEDIAYDNTDSGLGSTDVQAAIDEICDNIPSAIGNEIDAFSATLAAVATSGDYDDLSNKPTIPSLTGYATQTYVNDAVAGITIPDVSDFITERQAYGIAADEAAAQVSILESSLATVAKSGSYNDLTDKPTIPAAPDLSSYATKSELSAKANAADLATVATSGSYNDLSNKPTIPSTSGLASETYVDNAIAAIDIPDVSDFVEASDLASVATSGSYNDLSDKPTIPDISGLTAQDIGYSNPDRYTYAEQITNVKKVINLLENRLDGTVLSSSLATVATSGDYDDLSNKPTIPSVSGLATETYVDNAVAAITVPTKVSDLDNDSMFVDEGMAKSFAIDEINNNVSAAGLSGDYDDLINKPTIPTVPTNVSSFTNDAGYLTSHQDISGKANIADLATVATTGDYDDLTNKPTIPVLPTLATVATSGSYNDLSDKPTIPGSYITSDNYVFDSILFNQNPFNSGIGYTSVSSVEDFNDAFLKGYVCRGTSTSTIRLSMNENWTHIHIKKNGDTYTVSTLTSGTIDATSGRLVWRIGERKYITLEVRGSNITDAQFKDVFVKLLKDNFLTYSNTTSGLTATTIQGAIDELAAASGGGSGITVQDVLDAVVNAEFEASDEYGNRVNLNTSSINYTSEVEDNGETTTIGSGFDCGVLGFSKSVDDGNETTENSFAITPNFDDGVLQVEIDGNDTKTIAFVEDLPSRVGWAYDSSTGYMTFTGMRDENY